MMASLLCVVKLALILFVFVCVVRTQRSEPVGWGVCEWTTSARRNQTANYRAGSERGQTM